MNFARMYPLHAASGAPYAARTRQGAKMQRCTRAAGAIAAWWKETKQPVAGVQLDPITFDPIVDPFVHVEATGQQNVFSATSLAAYIESSGDYRNPVTRTPFNDVEIKRLQKTARRHGMETSIASRERYLEQRKRDLEESSLTLWLENEFLGQVHTVREVLADFEREGASVLRDLGLALLPALHDAFLTLRSRNPERATAMLFIATKMLTDAPVVHPTARVVALSFVSDLRGGSTDQRRRHALSTNGAAATGARGPRRAADGALRAGPAARLGRRRRAISAGAQAAPAAPPATADANRLHVFLNSMLQASRGGVHENGEWPAQRLSASVASTGRPIPPTTYHRSPFV